MGLADQDYYWALTVLTSINRCTAVSGRLAPVRQPRVFKQCNKHLNMVITYTEVFRAVIIYFYSQDVQLCSIVIQLHDQMTTYLHKKKKKNKKKKTTF